MTHPHLADAIYRFWFGSDGDRVYRRTHLQAGFQSAAARFGLPVAERLAPLWAVARLAAGRAPKPGEVRDLSARLDLVREDLRWVLPRLYPQAGSIPGFTQLTDLPVWTDLDAYFELHLQPAPFTALAQEVARTTVPRPGLRLACHKLLEHRDLHRAHVDGPEVVAELLSRLSEWRDEYGAQWHDWGALAEDFVRKCGVRAVDEAVRRFVTASPASRQAIDLVGCLVAMLASSHEAAPILLSWLGVARTSLPSWPGVLGDIHTRQGRSPEFDRQAMRFLSEQPTHGSWSFFWEYLWHANAVDREELEEKALAWLGAPLAPAQ